MRTRRVWLFANRALCVRACVALAVATGLPKQLTEGDVTRIGAIRRPALPRVRWCCRPRAITVGPLAGQWAILPRISDPEVQALLGTSLAVPATYDGLSVPGGAGTWAFALAASVAPSPDHNGEDQDP